TVRARWHTPAGWTAWTLAEDDSAEPDAAERDGVRLGTEPLWRPPLADQVELDVRGTQTGVRLVRVTDGVQHSVRRFGGARAEAATGAALLGDVRSRAEWGADESMRSGRPSYASTVKAVVVHHTAGRNEYSRDEVPAVIRADYAYHVRGRGWSDLGYNLLVDRFGRIWEGRYGGIGKATIGAHAQGFNTGTLGVSMLGDATRTNPGPQVTRALAQVTAYAAATWRFDPTTSVTLRSGGSPKFRSGQRVTLKRVFGHKETGQTACPGVLQDRLGAVRAGAKTLLGPAPRILSVTVSERPLGVPVPVDVKATLSRSTPWRVALRDARNRVVANAAGEDAAPELIWSGLVPLADGQPGVLPAPPGRYTWTVVADNGFQAPARRSGVIEVKVPLAG
ncbi:MAG: repeat protein, partial [Frankiales bacterium]|nr:repeat protein [Frankiales bacterium]